jgi:hypothetical protein
MNSLQYPFLLASAQFPFVFRKHHQFSIDSILSENIILLLLHKASFLDEPGISLKIKNAGRLGDLGYAILIGINGKEKRIIFHFDKEDKFITAIEKVLLQFNELLRQHQISRQLCLIQHKAHGYLRYVSYDKSKAVRLLNDLTNFPPREKFTLQFLMLILIPTNI